MKTILTMLGIVAALPAAACADEDCAVPMAEWQPRQAVVALAAENGWSVRRIKIDDGCYEIDGWDGDDRPIEVTLDPATLAVIELEYEDEDEDRDRERRDRDRDKPRPDRRD